MTYSTDHALIGTGGTRGGARECPAAAGPRRGAPERHQSLEDGFVPVRVERGGRPIGALGLTQDYRAIVQIVEAFRHTAVILFIALLALGRADPILRRATAQLHERNRQLVTQANELRQALLERGEPRRPSFSSPRSSSPPTTRLQGRRSAARSSLERRVPSGSSATRPTR